MSFPWQNAAWREAAEFMGPVARRGERILAPDQFWSIVSRVERYVPANLTTGHEDPQAAYDWVVLDLHDMAQIPRAFLESVAASMTPVFANLHFVIWSADATLEPDRELRDRLTEFWIRLAALGAEPSVPNRYVLDRALTDAPSLMRFADLSDAELRAAMNELFTRTGYLFPTRRDQGYVNDLQQHVAGFLERCPDGRVLDLCAGGMRFVDLPDGKQLVRAELSEVGVSVARRNDGTRPGVRYAVMDAQNLALADASFEAVVFTDSIEHVRNPALVFRESARVLVAGGWLIVSFQNRNSLHLLITEKLGYPKFMTSHQHFREFAVGEISELLRSVGFEIRDTVGVSLYPYWGVPGIDEFVRDITDDDPEIVDLMQELGRRAGAEYAHTGVVIAQRM